jgi:hypothetical protein
MSQVHLFLMSEVPLILVSEVPLFLMSAVSLFLMCEVPQFASLGMQRAGGDATHFLLCLLSSQCTR